ncbi:hypothetical protein DFQ28_011434 [Apophysomyces sp. BC1034]|nr:hypothetical protein DFQ29_009172 [Apophysomyces sp. BC1021]KAG0191595.1 hypothetical protein DFQ28_011434 [Apophysomyces sp. BC1034]
MVLINKMEVVYSDECLLHDPPTQIRHGEETVYPESPARLKSIKSFIDAHAEFTVLSPRDYTIQPVLAVHKPDFVQFLKDIYQEWVDEGHSPEAVVGEVFAHPSFLRHLGDQWKTTAQSSASSKYGTYVFDVSAVLMKCFCFVNNVAVAARFLQNHTLQDMDRFLENGELPVSQSKKQKILIVDIDYHQLSALFSLCQVLTEDLCSGNGTQTIFYNDPSVFYISLHCSPDYPYFTGSEAEIGIGPGTGYNINIPLSKTTTDAEYLGALTDVLNRATVTEFGADIVICSLGVDTWHEDPIAGMKLESLDTYGKIGHLFKTSKSCEGRPVLFVQEGGYTVSRLGDLVGQVLLGYKN